MKYKILVVDDEENIRWALKESKENIKMAKELGVYCYLTKPFDLLELKPILKKL